VVRRSREIGGGGRRRDGWFCGHGLHLFDDLPRSVLWVILEAVWIVSDRDIGSSRGTSLCFVDRKVSWGPRVSGARVKYSRWRRMRQARRGFRFPGDTSAIAYGRLRG
jgi:hypothetical protein